MKTAPDVPLSKVEWRVDSEPYDRQDGTVCRFVPYIDGRDAAALLDEWVGPENWSDTYEVVDVLGQPALECRLSVRDEQGDWVTKRDVGVASNMEAQKGAYSDAFKRAACIKWGVGRNVYELPTLYAVCDVRNRGQKTIAVKNRHTGADIARQLKERGFTDEDTTPRVEEPAGEGAEETPRSTGEDPSPAETSGEGNEADNASPAPSPETNQTGKASGPPGKQVLDLIRERCTDHGAAKEHVKKVAGVTNLMRLKADQIPDAIAAVNAIADQQHAQGEEEF